MIATVTSPPAALRVPSKSEYIWAILSANYFTNPLWWVFDDSSILWSLAWKISALCDLADELAATKQLLCALIALKYILICVGTDLSCVFLRSCSNSLPKPLIAFSSSENQVPALDTPLCYKWLLLCFATSILPCCTSLCYFLWHIMGLLLYIERHYITRLSFCFRTVLNISLACILLWSFCRLGVGHLYNRTRLLRLTLTLCLPCHWQIHPMTVDIYFPSCIDWTYILL